MDMGNNLEDVLESVLDSDSLCSDIEFDTDFLSGSDSEIELEILATDDESNSGFEVEKFSGSKEMLEEQASDVAAGIDSLPTDDELDLISEIGSDDEISFSDAVGSLSGSGSDVGSEENLVMGNNSNSDEGNKLPTPAKVDAEGLPQEFNPVDNLRGRTLSAIMSPSGSTVDDGRTVMSFSGNIIDLNILLVEDDFIQTMLLENKITDTTRAGELQEKIFKAKNSLEAEKLLNHHFFDLIILDENLGNDSLKGTDIARKVRNQQFGEYNRDSYIISTSSDAHKLASSEHRELYNEFPGKQVATGELVEIFSRAIENKEVSRQNRCDKFRNMPNNDEMCFIL